MSKKDPFPVQHAPGATPLDPNETGGLIPDFVSTQGELNQVEQENILKAKARLTRPKPERLLTDTFVRDLHRRMFEDVWKWAGQYRRSDKSIGVPWHRIPSDVRQLLLDTAYWIVNATYGWDELGARFHHRLVAIHPFPNGNGRHARWMTDLLLEAHDQPTFSWGWHAAQRPLDEADAPVRTEYIEALREADAKRLDRLVRFVRS